MLVLCDVRGPAEIFTEYEVRQTLHTMNWSVSRKVYIGMKALALCRSVPRFSIAVELNNSTCKLPNRDSYLKKKQKKKDLWSKVPDWARHQDVLTD
jgi:hypothetical protein